MLELPFNNNQMLAFVLAIDKINQKFVTVKILEV